MYFGDSASTTAPAISPIAAPNKHPRNLSFSVTISSVILAGNATECHRCGSGRTPPPAAGARRSLSDAWLSSLRLHSRGRHVAGGEIIAASFNRGRPAEIGGGDGDQSMKPHVIAVNRHQAKRGARP